MFNGCTNIILFIIATYPGDINSISLLSIWQSLLSSISDSSSLSESSRSDTNESMALLSILYLIGNSHDHVRPKIETRTRIVHIYAVPDNEYLTSPRVHASVHRARAHARERMHAHAGTSVNSIIHDLDWYHYPGQRQSDKCQHYWLVWTLFSPFSGTVT